MSSKKIVNSKSESSGLKSNSEDCFQDFADELANSIGHHKTVRRNLGARQNKQPQSKNYYNYLIPNVLTDAQYPQHEHQSSYIGTGPIFPVQCTRLAVKLWKVLQELHKAETQLRSECTTVETLSNIRELLELVLERSAHDCRYFKLDQQTDKQALNEKGPNDYAQDLQKYKHMKIQRAEKDKKL